MADSGVQSPESGRGSSLQRLPDSAHCILDVFMIVKSADTDKSFTAFAETGAGCADHSGFLEQHIEKCPGVRLPIHPDIGGVVPSNAIVSECGHFLPY